VCVWGRGRGKDGGVDGRGMNGFELGWWESQNCTASWVRWTCLDLYMGWIGVDWISCGRGCHISDLGGGGKGTFAALE